MPAPASNASLWTPEFLDSMRSVTDPEPDAVAAEVFADGGETALLQLKKFTDRWEAPITPDLPAPVREFFEKPVEYPSWVDFDKIRIVEDDFIPYGPIATVVLLLTGPTHFFCNPAGARSFFLAKIFSPASVKNRMHEIPQFVINITERDGLKQFPGPGSTVRKGRGVLTVQKLRFAHACIRIRLKKKRPSPDDEWDLSELQEPINQEDLAQALMDFCLATMDGLDKLGIEWSHEERTASLHFWKTVGFLLGLREELQPKDLEEARLLQKIITQRHARPTMEGTVLTTEMLDIMRGMLPRFYGFLPGSLLRYLAGDRVADSLQVAKHPFFLALMTLTRPFWRETKLVAWLVKAMTPKVMSWMITMEREGDRGKFRIPDYLAESWGVTT